MQTSFFGQKIMAAAVIGVVSLVFFMKPVRAANPDVVITEIGAYEASGHEWVEIYNRGEEAVDLTEWKFWEAGVNHNLTSGSDSGLTLEPRTYGIIAQDATNFANDYPAQHTLVLDSSWGTLNESGEVIGLKDGANLIIEEFTYSSAPDHSLERKNSAIDEYTNANWAEHPDGNTAGRENYWANSTPDTGSLTPASPPASDTVSAGKLLINEIVSDPVDGEKEWIELYNPGDETILLAGWSVEDGVGVIAILTNTIGSHDYLVIELASSKLNNAGDRVALKNVGGEIVDGVYYGNWSGTRPLEDNAIAPDKGQSLARLPDGDDTDTDSKDFVVTVVVTRGQSNGQTAWPSNESASSSSSLHTDDDNIHYASYEPQDIVINEFVSDPGDDEEEFVELYNRFTQPITLTGWWLEDGSESKTMLTGTIQPSRFLVIEKIKGNLNNVGDLIALFDPNGREIDRVVYGNWDDGKVNDNAPAPSDPMSAARRFTGIDTNNDREDFALTDVITKGENNRIVATPTSSQRVAPSSSAAVFMSEFFPNPAGSDSEKEFIELCNSSSTTVPLSGWQLGDSSKKRYTIGEENILPKQCLAFDRAKTGIALNNTGGDTVQLFSEAALLVEAASYDEAALDNQAFARDEQGRWSWTSVPTPGEENTIMSPPELIVPVIDVKKSVTLGEVVTFDASDTVSDKRNTATFSWDFGDGVGGQGEVVEHVFQKAGAFTVRLTVTNGESVGEETIKITVKNNLDNSDRFEEGGDTGLNNVRISEFVPNPVGADSEEFIELYNPNLFPVNLSFFQLDDDGGGSRAYIIPENTVINSEEYLVFPKDDTGLALNNSSDAVRLLSPEKTVLLAVVYDEAEEGGSYSNFDGVWQWTDALTPGEKNVLARTAVISKTKTTKKKATKGRLNLPLDKIRDADVGDKVAVEGTVAVLPGTFGSQYFYIVAASSSSPAAGVQIYMYKKDFPALALGDAVRVSGDVTETYGETRIKVAAQSDMAVIDHGSEPVAVGVAIVEVGEAYEGQLVSVQGEITEVKSTYLFIDDGTEELKVYFKQGIGVKPSVLKLGDVANIQGIVSERQGVYQLLPRGEADIKKIAETALPATTISAAADSGQKEVAETYLTATAGGLTSILVGLFVKARGSMLAGIVKRGGGVAIAFVKRNRNG